MTTKFHPAPLKEMARLTFQPMQPADRDAFPDVTDEQALIAYTADETWIIEANVLRIVEVDQREMAASQQFYVLDEWGESIGGL